MGFPSERDLLGLVRGDAAHALASLCYRVGQAAMADMGQGPEFAPWPVRSSRCCAAMDGKVSVVGDATANPPAEREQNLF